MTTEQKAYADYNAAQKVYVAAAEVLEKASQSFRDGDGSMDTVRQAQVACDTAARIYDDAGWVLEDVTGL